MTGPSHTVSQLCALCYDNLADCDDCDDCDNAVSSTKVTTQCCQEPICAKCADLHTIEPNNFICGNCSAATTLCGSNFTDVMTAFSTQLQNNYQAVKTMLEAALTRLDTQLGQIDQLASQLEQNMLAVRVTNNLALGGDHCDHDQTLLAAAITQYSHSYHKTIALSKAEHDQSYRQTQGRLRYLERLAAKLAELSLWQSESTDLTTYLQLDYDLKTLTINISSFNYPVVPPYQTVRWFNDRLVLDDVSQQYAAVNQERYRYRIYYRDIMARLTAVGLPKAELFSLVELPAEWPVVQSNLITGKEITEPLPAHLNCYKSKNGFALVDQAGQILYHSTATTIATVTKQWLVSLVIDSDPTKPCHDYDCRLRVQKLSQVLGRYNNLVTAEIVLEQALITEGYPLVQIHHNHLLLWYQRKLFAQGKWTGNTIWAYQQWWLQLNGHDIDIKLLYQRDLPPGQRVIHFYHNMVIVHEHLRYYCANLTSLVTQGTIPATALELPNHWLVSSDGSVVIERDYSQLYRPDGTIVAVATLNRWPSKLETTPWDGRLVRIGFDSDGVIGNNDNRMNVIEFY